MWVAATVFLCLVFRYVPEHSNIAILALFVAAWPLSWITRRDPNADRVKKGADQIEAEGKKLLRESSEYADARLDDYPQLDLAWYHSTTAVLGKLGLLHVADVLNLSDARDHPNVFTVFRLVASPDGVTSGSIHQVKFRGMHGLLVRIVARRMINARILQLSTELDSGHFIVTTNAPALATSLSQGPRIERVVLPAEMPYADLYKSHLGTVEQYLERNPGVGIVRSTTKEELLASSNREQAIRAEHRKSFDGGFTEDELRRIGGKAFSIEAKAVAAELDARAQSRPPRA